MRRPTCVRCGRPRSCPRRPCRAGGRTSRRAPRRSKPASSISRRHSTAESQWSSIDRRCARPTAPRGVSVRVPRPSRRARRSRARARARARASRRCPRCSARRRRRRGARRARAGRGRPQCLSASRPRPRMCSSERKGQIDERHALVHGRLAQIADPEVDELPDAVLVRVARGRPRASLPRGRRRSPSCPPAPSAPRCARCRPRARPPARRMRRASST